MSQGGTPWRDTISGTDLFEPSSTVAPWRIWWCCDDSVLLCVLIETSFRVLLGTGWLDPAAWCNYSGAGIFYLNFVPIIILLARRLVGSVLCRERASFVATQWHY